MQNQRLHQKRYGQLCGLCFSYRTSLTWDEACKLGPANFFDLRLTETSWKGKISIKGNVKSCATETIHAVDRRAGKQIFRKVSRGPQAGHEPAYVHLQKHRPIVCQAALQEVLPAGQGRVSSANHWWGHIWHAASSSRLSSLVHQRPDTLIELHRNE